MRSDTRRVIRVIELKTFVAKKTKGKKGYFKKLQTAGNCVVSFSKVDLSNKWLARSAIDARKKSFAGLAEIDECL